MIGFRVQAVRWLEVRITTFLFLFDPYPHLLEFLGNYMEEMRFAVVFS